MSTVLELVRPPDAYSASPPAPVAQKKLATGDYCISCEERAPQNECPDSERECGHHCNHSWSHDACDWCGQEWM